MTSPKSTDDLALRFEFDPDGPWTVTRSDPSRMIDGSHPEVGGIFAHRPAKGERLEERDLKADDVSVQHRRRNAA